jgi:hypothetical protein
MDRGIRELSKVRVRGPLAEFAPLVAAQARESGCTPRTTAGVLRLMADLSPAGSRSAHQRKPATAGVHPGPRQQAVARARRPRRPRRPRSGLRSGSPTPAAPPTPTLRQRRRSRRLDCQSYQAGVETVTGCQSFPGDGEHRARVRGRDGTLRSGKEKERSGGDVEPSAAGTGRGRGRPRPGVT